MSRLAEGILRQVWQISAANSHLRHIFRDVKGETGLNDFWVHRDS